MSKFIHIRGTTGSGKSTTVRQYLQLTGGFTLRQISVNGKMYPYHYNKDKNLVITGIYGRRNCDGCDGVITNRDIMLGYLLNIVTNVKPETIIFEAVMYGLSVTFAQDLIEELKKYGYEYTGIVLDPPLQFAYNNIMTRNGGKRINVEALKSKCDQARRSANTLKEAGVDIRFVDTSKMRVTEMHNIIVEAIK